MSDELRDRPLSSDLLADGSRVFYVFERGPEAASVSMDVLRSVLQAGGRWKVLSALTDFATEAHLDLEADGQRFSLIAQYRTWTLCGDPAMTGEKLAQELIRQVEQAILPVTASARAAGPIPPGNFRVVWSCAGGSGGQKDFAAFKDAAAYADDAASETEDGPTWASVFDDGFELVYEGRHY